MSRTNSKKAILAAAEEIVIESGALHMTLDAVAERAGISKGGLIYNFPSKEALLEAMIGRMMEHFDELREQARKQLSDAPYNDLMVEIKAFQGKSKMDRLGAALLAVVANQPELMRVMREDLQHRLFEKIARTEDDVRSLVLFFALMGLHFHNLLNISLLNQGQMKAVLDELIRLASCDENI
ncbi:TetR/AcrR family transcriptional regulator [Candidatus Sumerlaeota bacterium]|nr:TetR/AcrR family transcriptional regulator [Candidatus Sumerlaeota bacterium]